MALVAVIFLFLVLPIALIVWLVGGPAIVGWWESRRLRRLSGASDAAADAASLGSWMRASGTELDAVAASAHDMAGRDLRRETSWSRVALTIFFLIFTGVSGFGTMLQSSPSSFLIRSFVTAVIAGALLGAWWPFAVLVNWPLVLFGLLAWRRTLAGPDMVEFLKPVGICLLGGLAGRAIRGLLKPRTSRTR